MLSGTHLNKLIVLMVPRNWQ